MKFLKCLPLLLSLCCAYAEEVTKEELKEWHILADQGDAKAQFNLGTCYDKGYGVPQDYAQAVKWYRQAAEQGLALAQYSLGNCYVQGEVVPQDYAQAVKWYRKAAEQGLAKAQYDLGVCYANGNGVPQDDVKAYMWFNLSSAQGDVFAKKGKDNITKRMTKEQIAEGQKLSREWQEKTKKVE